MDVQNSEIQLQKIDPRVATQDLCQKSLDLLHSCILHWFLRSGVGAKQVWFADMDPRLLAMDRKNPETPLEIVFTGNFLLRIWEAPYWPCAKIRIWVLNERTQNIFVTLLGFSIDQVNVIPSSELQLPESHKLSPTKNQCSLEKLPLHWVFAGRLSPGKNIVGLLETVFYLQTEFHIPVHLDLFGRVDDEIDPSHGRFAVTSHHKMIEATLQTFPWIRRPVWHGEVPQFAWLPELKNESAFVSFSTHITEDFGTAAWLAEKTGNPCLLSDWGGHASLASEKVRYLAAAQIPLTSEPELLRRQKAKRLAQHLAFGWKQLAMRLRPPSTENSFAGAGLISVQDFQKPLQDFARRSPSETLFLMRQCLEMFADTKSGKLFFQRYRFVMSGESSPQVLVIYPEIEGSDNNRRAMLAELTSGAANTLQTELTEFIPARDALTPFYLGRLGAYQSVRVLGHSPSAEKMTALLTELQGL